MADLDRAIAAAREAVQELDGFKHPELADAYLAHCVGTLRDLLAALDAAQAPPAELAVPEVDWRALYRFQTAMRYMDADAKLTREKAYAMADKDVAAMLAAALAERNNTGDNP